MKEMHNNSNNLSDLDEASVSQIPALVQLVNLGYKYISREDVSKMREGKGQYILRPIALSAIKALNPDISEKSIYDTLVDLEKVKLDEGVFKASEHIFTDLLCGRSVNEIVAGKKVSPQLKFIDFANPENNVFNVTCEFGISEDALRRPDIVLFINGFPMAVIECKRGSVSVEEAVLQHICNQSGSNTPKFFLFPQILIATNGNALKYGTMLTPPNHYSVWKEPISDGVAESINTQIDDSVLSQICADLDRPDFIQQKILTPNAQACGIFNLLRKERILDIIRNYILYDNGVKKIARYQQVFAVKKAIARAQENPHRGGLIWHTQGSGKSLTMVMLVKKLTETFVNPRVIVVTDRHDLDKQISDTFSACNIKKGVTKVKNTNELITFIKDKSLDVITTLIQKFDRVKDKSFSDPDSNVFILIDEAHRSQGGEANAWMNAILPNACQIAFTGTPLMREEKSSIGKFGGLIDSYTISQAEEDGAILPLVYQAMFVEMKTNPHMIDEFYSRISKPLSDEQRKDFEKKALSSKMMDENSSRIELIALNIVDHYKANFQGTGLKGQIVMPSKYTAIICKQAIDLLGGVSAEVIISSSGNGGSDSDENGDDNLPEQKKVVANFEREQKRRFGSLETREKNLIADFRDNPNGLELIIVVDKLLTGFDAPRNTVLYLAKQLKDHNLLQAIARVNRIFNGDTGKQIKESGIIIDYSKNAENLKHAMELFSNYAPEDVEHALISTDEKVHELEVVYQKILDTLKNRSSDDVVSFLKSDERVRVEFYENVNDFIRIFSTCLSLSDFNKKVLPQELDRYCKDLKRFTELKKTTQLALAEIVDFSKYRDQLHKILDKYVSAIEVEELSKMINLSDVREFNRFVDDQKNGMSDRSKAEAIAAQTKRVISERYKEDVAFYEKFSIRIEKLLSDLKVAKQTDLAILLGDIREVQSQVDKYEDSDIPQFIRIQKSYHPFFRNLKQFVPAQDDIIAKIIKEVGDIITREKCVDWDKNITVERIAKDKIDDFLYDYVIAKMGVELTPNQISAITNEAWNIAVNNVDRL